MKCSDKVSIIVPIYNTQKFLSKCIGSLINQSYKNIEIILIDDGSTDNSLKIIKDYKKKDKRIIIKHIKNNGVSNARNVGIDISTGKYICFVDSDDYAMKDYVEYLFNLIKLNNSEIALSTSLYTNYNLKQNKKIYKKIYTNEDAVESILCYNIPIGVYNKIFLKSFLDKNIRFSKELCIGEGFNFNVNAFQNAKSITVSNKKIYFYRRNNTNSVTTKFNELKLENALYALEFMKKNLIINSSRINKAWEFANWRTHTDVYDKIVLSGIKYRENKLYQKCIREIKKYVFSYRSVPVSNNQKLRALIIFVSPKLIPLLLKFRKKILLKEVNYE